MPRTDSSPVFDDIIQCIGNTPLVRMRHERREEGREKGEERLCVLFVTVHGTIVILSAAKDLVRSAHSFEILRCAQDDRYPTGL